MRIIGVRSVLVIVSLFLLASTAHSQIEIVPGSAFRRERIFGEKSRLLLSSINGLLKFNSDILKLPLPAHLEGDDVSCPAPAELLSQFGETFDSHSGDGMNNVSDLELKTRQLIRHCRDDDAAVCQRQDREAVENFLAEVDDDDSKLGYAISRWINVIEESGEIFRALDYCHVEGQDVFSPQDVQADNFTGTPLIDVNVELPCVLHGPFIETFDDVSDADTGVRGR